MLSDEILRFLSEIEIDITTGGQSEITISIFTVSKNGLSEITARTLTFLDGTADVTYCADVTLFLHATSDGLLLTAAFSLRLFLAFYCLNCYLVSFSRYKTLKYINIMSPKHTEQDQNDAKRLGKRLVF